MAKTQQPQASPSQVYFVQFTHPGAEHVLSKTAIANGVTTYPWNYKNHKRKFLETRAQYVDNNNNLQNGEILFWGEWEPDSIVREIIPAPNQGNDLPHNIHNPLYITDKNNIPLAPQTIRNRKTGKYLLRQNTDPFVFGDCFYYSLCKQSRFVKLRYLTPGSIILFGSTINQNTPNAYFALDTVFVVGDSTTYSPNTYMTDLQGFVSNYYTNIMGMDLWSKYFKNNNIVGNSCSIKPSKNGCVSQMKYTCYKGATYSNPINNMYSFVPCVLSANNPQGFERIKLTANDFNNIGLPMPGIHIFTNNLNSAPKISIVSIKDNKKIWDKIRTIVHSKGCFEGVKMDYRHIIVP